MSGLNELGKILEKDPIITTYKSTELLKDPKKVEEKYSLHADTHMSLANTEVYYKRLENCLIENKNTFVGGVTGDYGLGKTSILVYFWRQLCQKNVLAVPPYWWDDFNDNFRCVYVWVKYELEKINKSLVIDLDAIYKKYTEPSLDNYAKEMVSKLNTNYAAAHSYVKEQYNLGKLNLSLKPEDFINFMSEVTTEFVEKQKLFKAFIVFNDELQRTVEKNTLDTVAGILFDLSTSLCDKEGKFGLMIGMPIQTQAALAVERSDIFDRLEKYKCFITLEEMYGSSFALDLWEKYANYFNIKEISSKIITRNALVALGQIADSKRKDLGNGPRTVISAFNRIVYKYNLTNSAYEVTDLVKDCLDKEITLGDRSTYINRVNQLLEMPFVLENPSVETSIFILAGFPKGCSLSIIEKYNISEGLDILLKKVYGEVIKEIPDGYILLPLMEPGTKKSQSDIENRFLQFRNKYSPDNLNTHRATQAFKKYFIPKIFSDWKDEGGGKEFKWMESQAGDFRCSIRGTFVDNGQKQRFPQRTLDIIVTNNGSINNYNNKETHFTIIFNLICKKVGEDFQNYIEFKDNTTLNKTVININLLENLKEFMLPVINPELIHQKFITPHFCLGLLYYLLDESTISKAEFEGLNHINKQLIDKLVSYIFTENMVNIRNSEKKLNHAGRFLIPELFNYICETKYPTYSTLIVSDQWESRLQRYVALLENEKFNINAKRGKEPIIKDIEKKSVKKQISDNLGISPATLDTWANLFTDLIDVSKVEYGEVALKNHPLEQYIVDLIDASNETHKDNGILCKCINIKNVIKEATSQGYLQEEIQFIITKLGLNRRYFNLEKNKQLLYRVPVSLDELKDTLTDKLEAIKKEYDNLSIFEDFNPNMDLDSVRKEIVDLSNDEQYESLKHRLHTVFEINHRWIKIKMDEWDQTVQKNKNNIVTSINNFIKSDFLITTKKLNSNSNWVSIVFEIQSVDIKKDMDDIKEELSNLVQMSNEISTLSKKSDLEIAQSGSVDILTLFEKFNKVSEKVEYTKSLFNILSQNVKSLTKWHQLCNKTNEIYEICIKAKTLGSDEYYGKYNGIGDDIISHMSKHRKAGLKNHEEFLNRYSELEKDTQTFIFSFKKQFHQIRDEYCIFVDKIGGDKSSLSRLTFSDLSPDESYENLFIETSSCISKVFDEVLSDTLAIQNEIDYLDRILGKNEEIENSGLKVRSKELLTNTKDLTKIDINKIVRNNNLADIEMVIIQIRNMFNECNKIYRSLLVPEEPSVSEKELLALLEKNIEKDFKEIILRLAENNPQNLDLDNTLNLLKSLFKKNQLTIRIKRM